jgi:hypothetical protein
MASLYLHNFRGFHDQEMPLAKVSFLVGENSTGKTSVLAMLRLLTRPDFWVTGKFNTEEHEFGLYGNIASASDGGFWVGLTDDAEGDAFVGFLAWFRERHGLPYAHSLAMLAGTKLGVVVVRPGGIGYRIVDRTDRREAALKGGELSALRQTVESLGTSLRRLHWPGRFRAETVSIGSMSAILRQLLLAEDEEMDVRQLAYPQIADNCSWISPIRTKPQRTYGMYIGDYSPEGAHTPYVLSKNLADGKRALAFRDALERFGRASGLFQEVQVFKYGRQSSAPFEVRVILDRQPLSVADVGYGVAQVLPVVVELIRGKADAWTLIQQPEVHLHPRAQAALGELVFEVSRTRGRRLLLETHSDYMIDRFRICTREGEADGSSAQVLFFERTQRGNVAHALPIGADGEYPVEQPEGFRTFFLQEQMKLLGL